MKPTNIPKPESDLLAQMLADAESTNDDFGLTDLDYGCMLLGSLDYEAQILAIKDLLRRNALEEERVSREIKDLEVRAGRATGLVNQWMVDQRIDLLHGSVFQDAAHSMAAVGMLAPLIETIFHHAFLAIGRNSVSTPDTRRHMSSKDMWDCHYVGTHGRQKGRHKNLIEGIFQLADAVGLGPLLPTKTKAMLNAIIAYRNKMFHHGFEWPVDQRMEFSRRIRLEKWPPSWFCSSRTGGHPWVYYLSETFIEEFLSLIDEILVVLGRFSRNFNN